MKLLGIDFGTKRTGIAVAETPSLLTFPLRTFAESDIDILIEKIVDVVKEEGSEKVIVGIPYRLTGSGTVGQTEQAVLDFVEKLQKKIAIPVITEDERMTTAAVERIRKDAGISKEKFDKDAAAAAAILETYIIRTSRGGV